MQASAIAGLLVACRDRYSPAGSMRAGAEVEAKQPGGDFSDRWIER